MDFRDIFLSMSKRGFQAAWPATESGLYRLLALSEAEFIKGPSQGYLLRKKGLVFLNQVRISGKLVQRFRGRETAIEGIDLPAPSILTHDSPFL